MYPKEEAQPQIHAQYYNLHAIYKNEKVENFKCWLSGENVQRLLGTHLRVTQVVTEKCFWGMYILTWATSINNTAWEGQEANSS